MVRQKFKPFQKAKDAKEFWDNAEEPQEGLVPLFNSPFYATPDTPADPQDCNRYPDSPWCGGNPLTGNFAPSIEVTLVRDECNLGIQLNGSFAFIKVPPVQIVYRNPECVSDERTTRPFKDPSSEIFKYPCGDGSYWSVCLAGSQEARTVTPWSLLARGEGELKIFEYGSPVQEYVAFQRQQAKENLAYLASHPVDMGGGARDVEFRKTSTTNHYEGRGFHYFGLARYSQSTEILELQLHPQLNITYASIWYKAHTHDYYSQLYHYLWDIEIVFTPPPCPSTNPVLIPPPPPSPRMSCCPNVEQNDQLLRLILKKIGSTQLPATVPKVLTNRQKGTIKIESLAEFTAYTVKQMDALCGRYPIDIEIEDTDLTKEGNQTKKIKLPNIAETLAEMMGMLLVLRSESDATLNATIRALTEAGSAKQMAFMAYEYAKANAEFLGYKGEQKERKIPFAFKPGEVRLDKMLVEGEMSVKGWENEDKDDFNDLIAPLLELAAMWKVANYRKTGAGDPKESIKKFLKNAGKLSGDIDAGILLEKAKAYNAKDDKDKNPKDLEDDWDKFTEEAEKGFISQPGITDKENPYGRPLEERPRIRDISSDTSEEK
jgi:hypothetical protein